MKNLIATTALVLAIASPAFAQSKLSDAERADFRAEVRAYIWKTPRS
ncbi:hypothetical protein [Pseudorhodobacter sp.]|nr:hypothetical protein [Pseudorhodobacter sp.]